MKGWLIVGIVLVCLWLVGQLRLGAVLIYEKSLTLRLRVGCLRFSILPRPDKPEKKPRKTKQNEQNSEKKPGKKIEDPVGLVLELLPLLLEALGKLRKKIRVDRIFLCWLGGGLDDPAAAAMMYGRLQAAVGGLLPVLESAADIKEYRFRMDVDYAAEKTIWEIELSLSMTLGQLLILAIWLGWNGLSIFMRHSRTNKQKAGIKNGEQKPAN